jgi:hypothetical protein
MYLPYAVWIHYPHDETVCICLKKTIMGFHIVYDLVSRRRIFPTIIVFIPKMNLFDINCYGAENPSHDFIKPPIYV